MSTPALAPGDFALTKISGWGGFAISLGQRLIGRPSPVQHAMIYVGDGMIVQAMPGGAERIPLADANPVYLWSSGWIPLTAKERVAITNAAINFVGMPYSWLDYLAIGLHAWHIRLPWVKRRVESGKSMICSQLVDEAYFRGGVDLFPWNESWDTTPTDLYNRLRHGQ